MSDSPLLDKCLEIERKYHADHVVSGEWINCIPCLRTRLASAEEALRYNQSQFRFIFNATTSEEVASCAEYSGVKIDRYFQKFKESEK